MNNPENSGPKKPEHSSSCKHEHDSARAANDKAVSSMSEQNSRCNHEHSQSSVHSQCSTNAPCEHSHKPTAHSERSEPSIEETTSQAKETSFSKVVGFMDIAGVIASTLCMVHCLLLPIIVALLPVLAKPLMQEDWVHMSLAGFVLAFCLIAYIPGYLQHRDKRLIYVGLVGLTLVFFATFIARAWGEIVEASIITAGNTVIIFGHMLNRRRLTYVKCNHKHH